MKTVIHSPEDIQRDTEKLVRFLSIFCDAHHRQRARKQFSFEYDRIPAVVHDGPVLCEDCRRLLRHAIMMRVYCPLEPKPKCRRCPEHCYRPRFKEGMEEVMRYSGPRSLFRK